MVFRPFVQILLFLVLALPVLAQKSVSATKPTRTALVIGNAKYEPAAGPLRNPVKDAKAMAAVLRSLGFAVLEKHDVNRDQMLAVMLQFRQSLAQAEVAVFYYAGHGISVGGSNYLLPIKSGYTTDAADAITLRLLAETRLFNVEQAVADMSAAGARCNLIILDACRNTPLARTALTRDVSQAGGLKEMTPPAGSLIAFATDAGQTAKDGDGTQGLYTGELLKHLQTPGLTIEQVFKRTRAGVLDQSQGTQIPAEYSRLVGEDIYLAGPALPTPEPEEPAPAPPEAAAPAPASVAMADPSPSGTMERTTTPPAPLPTQSELLKLAKDGPVEECLDALLRIAQEKGPGEFSVEPLTLVLDDVKQKLKGATAESTDLIFCQSVCTYTLQILPKVLPVAHEQHTVLAAQAHSRRGDALLLAGQNAEALKDFEVARLLAPDDAYILYNEACALAALGRKEEARAGFQEVLSPKFNQPGARKLAQEALKKLE